MRRTPENGDRGREPGIIIHLIRLERIYQLGTFITVKDTEKKAAKLAQTRPDQQIVDKLLLISGSISRQQENRGEMAKWMRVRLGR